MNRKPKSRNGGCSASDVAERMESAALTLRRLPNPPGSGPKGYGRSWPEYAQDPRHAYGYNEARMRVWPSPGDISAMEECFEWLQLVSPENAKIVWMRAEGRHWREICIEAGCVRQTAWRRWVAALATIAKKVNGGRLAHQKAPSCR
ncbi:MAG: helix-turn-helix domain-containing protein [Alphaproteobacteria bacterium]|nr:helix-turn-helix domain-containing protein [Alphaproteobacteria bacterium]